MNESQDVLYGEGCSHSAFRRRSDFFSLEDVEFLRLVAGQWRELRLGDHQLAVFEEIIEKVEGMVPRRLIELKRWPMTAEDLASLPPGRVCHTDGKVWWEPSK